MVEKVKVIYNGKEYNILKKYIEGLKGNDRRKQIKSIIEGKDRPKTKFKSERSGWVKKFEDKYKHKITDEKWIHENIITRTGQKKIISKGMKAYYTSGSRPNQNPYSWSYARLASVILFGPSFKIDKDIAEKYGKKKWLNSK
jgi:hypothetical protein